MTSLTETGTGMRITLEEKVVPLSISRSVKKETLQQTHALPKHYLQQEPPRTRERAVDLWNSRVLKTMADLIRTRKSRGMNKHMRRVVFKSGMENLVMQFNRSTENIKVDFQEHYDSSISNNNNNNNTSSRQSLSYSLKYCLLTPIPESIRNAPSCAAEIVRLEQDRITRAQLMGTTNDNEGQSCFPSGIVTEIIGANGRIQPPEQQQQQQQEHGNLPLQATPALPAITSTSEAIPLAVAMSVDSNSIISSSMDEHWQSGSERSWQEMALSHRQDDQDEALANWATREAPVATAVICEVLDAED